MDDKPVNPRDNLQSFEAEDLSIREFCRSSHYAVPEYQRPYCWEADQVEVLMADLLFFYASVMPESTQAVFSLGTIVCDRDDESHFIVLDGQQRLTTLDLLFKKLAELKKEASADPSHDSDPVLCIIEDYRNQPDGLPEPEAQLAAIDKSLTDSSVNLNSKSLMELERFENAVRDRVRVRRIVIPMRRLKGEAPRMFEIINIRGQSLKPLEIFKSRLLSLIGEDEVDRQVFSAFWLNAQEALGNGKAFAEVRIPTSSDMKTEAGPRAVDFSSILSASSVGNEPKSKTAVESTSETKESDMAAPIEMADLMVMASVLMNWVLSKEKKAGKNFDTLGEGDRGRRLDQIVKSLSSASQVWTLLGAAAVVLMTTIAWGVYRDRSNDLIPCGPRDPFSQLTLSFFALNSYRSDGQYWHLLLSAYALMHIAENKLPENHKEFADYANGIKHRDFKQYRKEAFTHLCRWACKYADENCESLTSEIFRIVDAGCGAEKLKMPEFDPLEAKWDDRNYHKRWRLYLTDYLVWADSRNPECFAQMKKAAIEDSWKSDDNAAQEVAEVLSNWDWDSFQRWISNETIRIVSKTAVEHWIPQISENRGVEKDTLNLFGNLALIDSPTNSSLRDDGSTSKSKKILNDSANPSIKLYWLARFTDALKQKGVDMDAEHLKALTDFWFEFLRSYDFNSIKLK